MVVYIVLVSTSDLVGVVGPALERLNNRIENLRLPRLHRLYQKLNLFFFLFYRISYHCMWPGLYHSEKMDQWNAGKDFSVGFSKGPCYCF